MSTRVRAPRLPRRRTVAIAGLTLLTAVVVAATLGTGGGAVASTPGSGGTITVLSAGDVDHIDPGQAYYSFSYEVTYATQRPLLAYKPTSVKAVPDLASAMPTVSADGRTVTVHIRNDVRFSPPVNRDVTSGDVKYAIERGFAASVANGYVGAYFRDVVGAPAKTTKTVPDITGIQTPNSSTIVFKLKRPEGAFIGALGLPVTAPVPVSYARPFDARTVSTYGLHQVATGPYMIKNNGSGSINGVGYQPARRSTSSATRTGTRRRAGGRHTRIRSCSRRGTRIPPS